MLVDSRRNELRDVRFSLTKATHAGLWLDKYLEKQEVKEAEGRQNRKEQGGQQTNIKSNLIREVAQLPVSPIYHDFYQRWQKTLLQECQAVTRNARVMGRMVIGLGEESVLETAVTLHHTYGVPYIPGSALKGLAASYAHQRLDDKEWRKGGQAHKVIFGDTEDAGYITFFDALYVPYKGQVLYPDIITVHHPKYYQGNEAPADWDSPTPIPFLSATGTYLIALAAPEMEQAQRQKWIDATFAMLEQALKTMGIGAKTSSGYGRMEFVYDPEVKRALKIKEEIEAFPKERVNKDIYPFYQQWQTIKSDEARAIVAIAIIERVRATEYEQAKSQKDWYRELVEFVSK